MPIPAAQYDANNVFAKILRGEMPSEKVYEDAHSFALMDIMPRVEGHTLIIPKAASRNILDAAPEDLAHVIALTQRIARAAVSAFDADGVAIHQFSESAGGQVVFHLHFHVLPRKEGVEMLPPGVKGDIAAIAQHAEKLRKALAAL